MSQLPKTAALIPGSKQVAHRREDQVGHTIWDHHLGSKNSVLRNLQESNDLCI